MRKQIGTVLNFPSLVIRRKIARCWWYNSGSNAARLWKEHFVLKNKKFEWLNVYQLHDKGPMWMLARLCGLQQDHLHSLRGIPAQPHWTNMPSYCPSRFQSILSFQHYQWLRAWRLFQLRRPIAVCNNNPSCRFRHSASPLEISLPAPALLATAFEP